MSHADLSGALVKIDRAKTHLRDLDKGCEPIIAACRNSITRECDEQRSEYTFRLDKVPDIPPILGGVAGDAIHNLRVSVDYLMGQLVIASGGTPGEKTCFPVLTTPPTPNRYGRSLPNVRPGIPRDMRVLLDAVQPYKRPDPANHDLAILRELDNRDKYRELPIAIIGPERPALGWRGDVELIRFNAGPYNDGSEVCRFSYPLRAASPNSTPRSPLRYASMTQQRERGVRCSARVISSFTC